MKRRRGSTPISSGELPRKRSRISIDTDATQKNAPDSMTTALTKASSPTAAETSLEASRDEEYYFDDGDCIIRVEDTLFKVHRFILSRDSSVFQDMFSLPPTEGGEGTSDNNPIFLFGEYAAEFRFLLYSLYALPGEVQGFASGALSTLLRLAHITNKYHFVTTEAWALSTLHDAFARMVLPELSSTIADPLGPLLGRTPFPAPGSATDGMDTRLQQLFNPPLSSKMFSRMLSVAIRSDHSKLIILAATTWGEVIRRHGLPAIEALASVDEHVPSRSAIPREYQDVSVANSADRTLAVDKATASKALSMLRTVSYYAVLLSLSTDLTLTPAQPAEENKKKPTRAQLRRLLAGHFALVRKWEALRVSPPELPRCNACTFHQRDCVEQWAAAWRDAAAVIADACAAATPPNAPPVQYQYATQPFAMPAQWPPGVPQQQVGLFQFPPGWTGFDQNTFENGMGQHMQGVVQLQATGQTPMYAQAFAVTAQMQAQIDAQAQTIANLQVQLAAAAQMQAAAQAQLQAAAETQMQAVEDAEALAAEEAQLALEDAPAGEGREADLLGKLAAMEQLIQHNADAKRSLSSACWREGLQSIKRLRKEVALWVLGVWVDPGEE